MTILIFFAFFFSFGVGLNLYKINEFPDLPPNLSGFKAGIEFEDSIDSRPTDLAVVSKSPELEETTLADSIEPVVMLQAKTAGCFDIFIIYLLDFSSI